VRVARALDGAVFRQIARFVDGSRVEQRDERARPLGARRVFEEVLCRTRVALCEPSRGDEGPLGVGRAIGAERGLFGARDRRRGRLARLGRARLEGRAVFCVEREPHARTLAPAADARHDAHPPLVDGRLRPALDAPAAELVAARRRELAAHDERRRRGGLEHDADRLRARHIDVDDDGA
jgi:hypothetical protein